MLGVFALTPDGQASGPDPTLFLQLAISKEGIINGTLNNSATDTTQTIEGMADKASQRAAWTATFHAVSAFCNAGFSLRSENLMGDRPALEELGIADFDVVAVCVGERLETAVLLVHHLHQMQVPRILVKVANAEQAEIVKLVGASEVIQPDQSAARKAALLIHHPRAADYLELGDGHLVIAGHPPSSVVGKTAGELSWQGRFGVSLLAVWQPGQEGPPLTPNPDRTIAEADVLILAGHIDRLRELRRRK